MIFNNRHQAGELLAARLKAYEGKQPLILAVPRGGIEIAWPLWKTLGGELDLIITRKIGAPYQPELAIGAVAGDGFVMLNDSLVSRLNVSAEYISKAVAREQDEIIRRLQLYRGDRLPPAAENRPVILVDDGVATGYTLLAALRSLQQKEATRLILAVPVGPPETFERLGPEVDELVYLEAPPHFAAVGQFYRDFKQVSDAEVIALLAKAR